VVGLVPEVDFEPAQEAFLSVAEEKIVPPRCLVDSLMGLYHLYLYPTKVKRSRNLSFLALDLIGLLQETWQKVVRRLSG
jgi:anion-transporting  ArsA/GET3 family ATPase